MRLDLGDLGFEEGGALLVKRTLRNAPAGEAVEVAGSAPDLAVHLRAWCRAEGHHFATTDGGAVIQPGSASADRWSGAERAGAADPLDPGAVLERPPQRWGLAARGALVEAGSPDFHFTLAEKIEVWSPDSARIYAQAAAAQWDP